MRLSASGSRLLALRYRERRERFPREPRAVLPRDVRSFTVDRFAAAVRVGPAVLVGGVTAGDEPRSSEDEGFSLVATDGLTHDRRMDVRYPIGRFTFDPVVTAESRAARIVMLRELPNALEKALQALPPGGLDRSYREGGWTARQVAHHITDSHLNAYVRVRLALTEENPTIKTYEESRWAELADARTADPTISLPILRGVHERLVLLLEALAPADFARAAQHPDSGPISVDWLLQLYAWHGRHHLGHLSLIQ